MISDKTALFAAGLVGAWGLAMLWCRPPVPPRAAPRQLRSHRLRDANDDDDDDAAADPVAAALADAGTWVL